ncbi:MAG TPA: sugar phosphate isomerase/epimerase [Bryobacteraceae bacterium]|nr:sugar phosphate isomerase/epimerase [Bryobacteraceae bacterium]
MYTRRDFHKIALAGASAAMAFGKPDSKVNGVWIGAQTYSLRRLPLDEAIKNFADIGIGAVELWSGHIEPKDRAQIKAWRTAKTTLDQMKEVRRKFDDAGIKVYALNYSFRAEHTDEEVLQGMEMAKLLGTKIITASSKVSQAKRLNDLCKKGGVKVAMHNHSNLKDPDEYATPESFAKAMEGNPNILLNLDIGHFVAANYDPIDYLKQHHAKIVTLHIKDRKKDQGANVPFGEGDTPIKQVLQTLKQNKGWGIPAMIEYEYKGADDVAEVRKCFEYCKQQLA